MVPKNKIQNGYMLIEFLTLSTVIFIFLGLALPDFVKTREVSKEDEVKANLHAIQVALERYMTDNGVYPSYLLGGDVDGWSNWHERWDGVNDIEMSDGRVATNGVVRDPLIEYNYFASYPSNPFLEDGSSVILRTNVDGTGNSGDGDPRFGYRGDIMGMGLDEMNYFKGAIHEGKFIWSEIETRRTLDRGDWMNVPDEFKDDVTNMYYLFGGTRQGMSYWPGNFFYKATADVVLPSRHGFSTTLPNVNQIGGPRTRYILGCYGAEGTGGLDVIRLEYRNPDGEIVSWRNSPPFGEVYRPETSFTKRSETWFTHYNGNHQETWGGICHSKRTARCLRRRSL